MDSNSKMTGAGGCQIINAAGTYTTAGETPTLIPNVTSIKVVTGVNEGITALQIKPVNGDAADIDAINNIVDADLSAIAGEILTFKHPVSTLTVAASQVLIAYAG